MKTVLVHVDVTFYSPSIGVTTVVRATFEVMSSGPVVPTYNAYSLDLWPYSTGDAWGSLRAAVELAAALWIMVYIYVELKDIRSYGWAYLSLEMSRKVHLVNIGLFAAWAGLRVAAYLYAPSHVVPHGDHFVSLRAAASMMRHAQNVISIFALPTFPLPPLDHSPPPPLRERLRETGAD